MIPIKGPVEIQKMRVACEIAATVLDQLCLAAQEGVTTYDLDQLAKKLIEDRGAQSACYNYRIGNKVFPAYSCISVNEEVVHGIGSMKRILKDGDIASIDVSIVFDGFVGDNARSIVIGTAPAEILKLVDVTYNALLAGIEKAVPGNRIGDISHVVQRHVESNRFSVVREFVGHGVGRSMHEEPQIPNFGTRGTGPMLKEGMTLAIEPMVNLGKASVEYAADGWTALTCDRSPSAHFEHTILVTAEGPEILTLPKK
jgi:methionyl aminopeptidase